ncbi:MAG: hypothetical protein WAW37_12565 [Syntrophobacteraceae bacterium]
MLNASKSELHKLVDALSEPETIIAKRFLEFLLSRIDDPVLQAFFNAHEDEEPLDKEDLKAVAEAEEDIAAGRVKPWEQVKTELDL